MVYCTGKGKPVGNGQVFPRVQVWVQIFWPGENPYPWLWVWVQVMSQSHRGSNQSCDSQICLEVQQTWPARLFLVQICLHVQQTWPATLFLFQICLQVQHTWPVRLFLVQICFRLDLWGFWNEKQRTVPVVWTAFKCSSAMNSTVARTANQTCSSVPWSCWTWTELLVQFGVWTRFALVPNQTCITTKPTGRYRSG